MHILRYFKPSASPLLFPPTRFSEPDGEMYVASALSGVKELKLVRYPAAAARAKRLSADSQVVLLARDNPELALPLHPDERADFLGQLLEASDHAVLDVWTSFPGAIDRATNICVLGERASYRNVSGKLTYPEILFSMAWHSQRSPLREASGLPYRD